MIRRSALLLTALVTVACDSPATAPEASRAPIATVRVGDMLYVASGLLGSEVVSAPVATVIRTITCDGVHVGNTHTSDVCLWEDGDAERLPVGTTLHAIEGHDTDERLTALYEDEWIVLKADPRYTPGSPF